MKFIVGVADMKISDNEGDVLLTYALGSCLGITAYDPVARVGGMIHVMLPLSAVDPERALDNPYTFVDTGVNKLLVECYGAGASKQRMIITAAGGASVQEEEEEDYFKIGKRNFIALRKLIWKNELLLRAYDVSGNSSRTMLLEIGSGEVTVKVNGQSTKLYSTNN